MTVVAKFLALGFLLPLVVWNHYQKDGKDWELVLSTDKIDIYTRKTETSLKEVKAIGTMDADLTSIIAALNNVEAYPDWVYNCIESKRFDVVSKDEFHYYVKTHIPFPLYDRDLVVNTKQWIDEQGFWCSNSIAKPDLKAEKSRVVRIKHFYSMWKIKSVNLSSVKFEYVLSVDPGGILPVWLINLGIKKAPLSTIKALEARAIELMRK